ncbi:MAG: MGH1-like glycoside hydrolase domain-containing protein [Bdellovibrionia bacterium]
MKEIRTLPSICTLHRLAGQGRKEPSTITLFKGWTRLTMDDHGEMHGAPMQGFYAAETQMLSHYEMRVNGSPIRHRLAVQLAPHEWSSNGAVLDSADSGNLPDRTLPRGSIEVRILRRIDQGWTERVIIKNNGAQKRHVEFELGLVCPMRDSQFEDEMKRDAVLKKKGLPAQLIEGNDWVGFRFDKVFGVRYRAPTEEFQATYGENAPRDGDEISRALEIRVRPLPGSPKAHIQLKRGGVNFIRVRSDLEGRQELCLELRYEPIANGERLLSPPLLSLEPLPHESADRTQSSLWIDTSHSMLNLILGQAMGDLNSIGLPVFDRTKTQTQNHQAFIAGIPRYLGLFGRDNLITAWQSAIFNPDLFEPVLSRLAELQGVKQEDWRDEEPDRLPHERRINPCAQVGITNREIYYGDVTSTPFWILALASLFRWTGEKELILRHEQTLQRCLNWVRTRLQQGAGYIYYAPALPGHPDENRNHAWKDSGDAIVDIDGRIRIPPLALVEIQAYAYQALIEAAEMLSVIDGSACGELWSEASALKARFNRDFWDQDSKFYVLALDQQGRQIKSKASNIGHALATSILDEDKVADLVRGLMAEDMFSGWGIRTLSSDNPAYDPFSYHRGSVWPVENAFIADGLAARGYHDEAHRIITGQFGLAAMFEHLRLPEVISGHPRDRQSPVPALYSYANLIQAWSISAIAQHLQVMLGIRPRADHGLLYLDPHLPEWLSWVEIKNLQFRGTRLQIRFWRSSDGRTHWNVIDNPGRVVVKSGAPIPFGEEKIAS